MPILNINDKDFSQKLKDFEFTCKKCNSNKVEISIDWASYPSGSWKNIDIACLDCKNTETILED